MIFLYLVTKNLNWKLIFIRRKISMRRYEEKTTYVCEARASNGTVLHQRWQKVQRPAEHKIQKTGMHATRRTLFCWNAPLRQSVALARGWECSAQNQHLEKRALTFTFVMANWFERLLPRWSVCFSDFSPTDYPSRVFTAPLLSAHLNIRHSAVNDRYSCFRADRRVLSCLFWYQNRWWRAIAAPDASLYISVQFCRVNFSDPARRSVRYLHRALYFLTLSDN